MSLVRAMAQGLERMTGDRGGPGVRILVATLRFGTLAVPFVVNPTLPVSFGGGTKTPSVPSIWCLCHGK